MDGNWLAKFFYDEAKDTNRQLPLILTILE